MRCEFRILSGGRAGHREAFDKAYVGLGRSPQSDVRFDPEQDLDASTRHAAVLKSGDHYVLRDLESRNGTFLNGHRIAADATLTPGDRIRCGPNGPEVEFQLVADGAEQVVPAVHAPAGARSPGATRDASPHPPAARAAAPSNTSVLRAQVSQQASRYRASLIVLGVVVLAAVGVVLWQGRTAQQQVATIGSQVDSLTRELRALRIAQAARGLRGQDPPRRAADGAGPGAARRAAAAVRRGPAAAARDHGSPGRGLGGHPPRQRARRRDDLRQVPRRLRVHRDGFRGVLERPPSHQQARGDRSRGPRPGADRRPVRRHHGRAARHPRAGLERRRHRVGAGHRRGHRTRWCAGSGPTAPAWATRSRCWAIREGWTRR